MNIEVSMAVQPNWMDEIFRKSSDKPETVARRLSKHPKFLAMMNAGIRAFVATEKEFKKNPGLLAPQPPAAARMAFVKAFKKAYPD
jgi:hypothetical protein